MSRTSLLAALLGFAVDSSAIAAEPAIRIVRNQAGQAVAFEASGLPEEDLTRLAGAAKRDETLGRVLSVYVVDGEAKDLPPMLGKYNIDESSLRFTPQFALRAGTRYKAVLQPAALAADGGDPKGEPVVLEIALPVPKRGAATVVTQIYPTSDKLPENQLRFYLHFSQPMSRGEAYQHVKLLDEMGKAIELPFLELGEELWDASGKRLTLLIDPGRIKRGLKPREDVGPVLEAGHKYTLTVDASWKDATGEPLKAGFEKKFATEKPVETAIDPAQWKIEAPAAGSQQPLVVRFPQPLDKALLERTIVVLDSSGQVINGSVTTSNQERQWGFTPAQAWPKRELMLEVDTVLEDLAGNQIGRAFEVEERAQSAAKRAEKVRIPVSAVARQPVR